jgi:hypothetical protein
MAAFILTWKEQVWPYQALRAFVDKFERDRVVEDFWQVRAHKQAKVGDLAFLLKQGANPRGIFGFGRLLEVPRLQEDPGEPGRLRMGARVRFEQLIDPKTHPFLIPLQELYGVLPEWQINAQASGQAALAPQHENWLIQRLNIANAPEEAASRPDRQLGRPTTGPKPSDWSGVVKRSGDLPAVTYAMQFGERSLWKIGHAQNLEDRLDEINKHLPVEVLDECWELALVHKCRDSLLAYDMEQKVLELLSKHRTIDERVMCSKSELEAAWTSAAAAMQRRPDLYQRRDIATPR